MSTEAAQIDPQLVKTLRDRTNAGMMDCKKALAEANGELDLAVDILRKKGAASAEKKAAREAKEGIIAQAIMPGAKVGVLLEVNCETDFVAKNDSFQEFCSEWARALAQDSAVDLEPSRIEAVTKVGENVQIRRHERMEVTGSGLVAAYIHTGGKVGVLVEVGAEKDETANSEVFKQLVRDITLQIAAATPVAVARGEVPAEVIEKEREIYREQAPKDKPPQVVERIIDGKVDKFYSGICLLEQAFIKNPDLTITQLLAERSKELGETLSIRRFVRFQVGA
jgi:elongation factor Ts